MDAQHSLESLNLILPSCFYHMDICNKLNENDVSDYVDEDVSRKVHPPAQGTSHAKQNTFTRDPMTLKGYSILYDLRHKTGEFRKGYTNWRQFKPKGARGEASDIVSGTNNEKDLLQSLSQVHLEKSFLDILDKKLLRSNDPKQLKKSSSNHLDPSDIVPHSSLQPIATSTSLQPLSTTVEATVPPSSTLGYRKSSLCLLSHTTSALVLKDEPDIVPHDVSPYSADEEEEKDKWLRFYYNPFTPAEERQALPINLENLKHFAASSYASIKVPHYNRNPKTVTHWILHIGVGQFHRAHQLVYMDDYLTQQHQELMKQKESMGHKTNQCRTLGVNDSSETSTTGYPLKTDEKWGYCGIGLTEYDKTMKDCLEPQDLLFTVLERNNKNSSARIVGSMLDFLLAYESPQKTLEYLISPKVRIVSLTITEKGYCQRVDGNLNIQHPWIEHDLEILKQRLAGRIISLEQCPKSALGLMAWGLYERRQRNVQGFTVLSCDNLPNNGSVVKSMLLSFAKELDSNFAEWISQNVSFPGTMVDRITPMVVDEHREILAKDFGILDRWPVVTEVFHQWVIEDIFPYGRPQWEDVGVMLVQDVAPFELMKLRLLNGGHSIIAYLSYLIGYTFVDDAMTDLRISSFLRSYMDEVTFTLPRVALDLDHYKETVIERFGNRLIKDALLRICEDGSSKFFNTLRSATLQLLQEQRHITAIALGVASFLVFLATSQPDIVKDAQKNVLIDMATQIFQQPTSVDLVGTYLRKIFGNELGCIPVFCHHVVLSILAIKYQSPELILSRGGVLPSLLFPHLVDSPESFSRLVDFVFQNEKSLL